MNFEIETASYKDAKDLAEIYAHYVKNTAVTFEYDVPTSEEFALRINNTLCKYPFIKAKADGKTVGFAYASSFHSREAYQFSAEISVYMHHMYRGSGGGRLLYSNLEQLLYAQHVTNLYACIACTEREDKYLTDASIRFHERMGYRSVGRLRNCGYKFGAWYDIVYMEKICFPRKVPAEKFISFADLRRTAGAEKNTCADKKEDI